MKPLMKLPTLLVVHGSIFALGILWHLTTPQCFLASATAQTPEIERQLLAAGATSEVYKTTSNATGAEVKLSIHIFQPENHQAHDRRPAIVFFYGGGWKNGRLSQFQPQCEHLASRGMVAMVADYRVFSRHKTKAIACVSDAKSAVRWIRQHAERLGVDPDRVASGGGSAGGHIAACTGLIKTLDEVTEDANISSVPNAMVLFNPAVVLAPIPGVTDVGERAERIAKKWAGLRARVGADPLTISPIHHIAADAPPTIVFHGKSDTTVPYWTAEAFAKAMKSAGNRCELVGYEGQGHGFFNRGRKHGKYAETTQAMDEFLVSLGFLEPNEAAALRIGVRKSG